MEQAILRSARMLAALLTLTAATQAPAATLAAFDFEDAGGAFELEPEQLAAGIAAAAWTALSGAPSDFAGDPGRAIAVSGFTGGNALRLTLIAAPGRAITLDGLTFDARASASGPDTWTLGTAVGTLLAGPVGGSFGPAGGPLAAGPDPAVVLEFGGTGASSSSGTLRLDNVVVSGAVSAVSLPPAVMLAATPLAGWLLGRLRRASGRWRRLRGSLGAAAQPG